jgi:dephospho-CoA kinase
VRDRAVAAPPDANAGAGAAAFIGLTGALGAGKSEALAALGRLGAATLSTDSLVHELLMTPELRQPLVERWGAEATTEEGGIDRSRVAAIVFERPEELAWLEAELHPRVGERVAAWRDSLPGEREVAVVEVPLLFETGMDGVFDATVAIVAEDATRARRAGVRGIAEFEGREARQLPQDEKASRATHVVRNDGTLEQLEAELARLWPKLREAARSRA